MTSLPFGTLVTKEAYHGDVFLRRDIFIRSEFLIFIYYYYYHYHHYYYYYYYCCCYCYYCYYYYYHYYYYHYFAKFMRYYFLSLFYYFFYYLFRNSILVWLKWCFEDPKGLFGKLYWVRKGQLVISIKPMHGLLAKFLQHFSNKEFVKLCWSGRKS